MPILTAILSVHLLIFAGFLPDAAQAQNLSPCDGEMNGIWDNCFGTFIYDNGKTYVGEWKDGKRHGEGTVVLPDGRQYAGEWRKDQPNGQGIYTWPDGANYVGEWKDGKKSGQGTFTWPDEAKYIGEWKSDLANGYGTQYFPNGEIVRQGLWEEGEFVQKISG